MNNKIKNEDIVDIANNSFFKDALSLARLTEDIEKEEDQRKKERLGEELRKKISEITS